MRIWRLLCGYLFGTYPGLGRPRLGKTELGQDPKLCYEEVAPGLYRLSRFQMEVKTAPQQTEETGVERHWREQAERDQLEQQQEMDRRAEEAGRNAEVWLRRR